MYVCAVDLLFPPGLSPLALLSQWASVAISVMRSREAARALMIQGDSSLSNSVTLNPVGGADSGHGGEIKTEEPDTEATHLGEINHREYLGH